MGYTLAQMQGYGRAVMRQERRRLKEAAIAARVAQAERAGWRKWIEALEDKDGGAARTNRD